MKRLALLIIALLLTGCLPRVEPFIPAGTLAAQTLAARPTTALPPPTATDRPTLTPTPDNRLPTPVLDLSIPGAYCIPPSSPRASGLVTRVLSGDTIEVAIGNTSWLVRFIGLDAPNLEAPAEWQAGQSQAYNGQLVGGKHVTLVQDVSEMNPEGFHPCYVIADGVFVNYEMIRQGFARAVDTPPDVTCRDSFIAAQAEAQSGVRGLWQPTPTSGPTATFTPTITWTPGPITATQEEVCNCKRSYKCTNFASQSDAQECFSYCKRTTGREVLQDKNGNGKVCEGTQ